MNIYRYPKQTEWANITTRPAFDQQSLDETVSDILRAVRIHGDSAVQHLTARFDGCELENSAVTADEIALAADSVAPELQTAIRRAAANIEKFHRAQVETVQRIETTPGVICWRENRAIERVGLYAPGGTAPLFSTVLMLAIPARIAGCKQIVLCSPPNPQGQIHPAILFAAQLCGVSQVFKIGGVQAVGAMAYGTRTVPRVDKIFGPGNQFVTHAKQAVAREGVALDMPAGPSEVAVFADKTAIPSFVAADLLSQAEHGPDSQVLLVTTDDTVLQLTMIELDHQLARLPRRDIAAQSIANSRAVVFDNDRDAIDLLNEYAAEHLILACQNAREVAARISNAGSIFIGHFSPESAGDYASGTNHTLPTNGYARNFSGVSVDSFVKKMTFQELSAGGLQNLGATIETMAAAENLDAHKRAVSIRLKWLAEQEAVPSSKFQVSGST